MEYFMEFHWWYVLVGIVLLIAFTGTHKGGAVVSRFTANLEIHDERFQGCEIEADYTTFKEGKPHHLEIELEKLTIPVGDELEYLINGKQLAMVPVRKNKEAEFDHWSDEKVYFPVVKEGDELAIKYQDKTVLKGLFELRT